MIAWMSDESNRLADDNNLEVYGFNNDDAEDAVVSVCKCDEWYYLRLGDVRDLTPEEIDARFQKELLAADGLLFDPELLDMSVAKGAA